MKKFDSLIYLVNSLSKAEKKNIAISITRNTTHNYSALYKIIVSSSSKEEKAIRAAYQDTGCGDTFEISVSYLYEKILDILETLRHGKDPVSDLFHQLTKVRILYDKDMYNECFSLLESIIQEARDHEAFEIMLLALTMRQEYLLGLNFPNISEQDLFHIHYTQKEVIKDIQKITEQSSLFDMLRYRLLHIGNFNQANQNRLKDLVVREFYISTSFGNRDNLFKVQKNHKLFQANYLMAMGETSSALKLFQELALLFDSTPQLQTDPPIYYLSVLESILYILRSHHNYNKIEFFRHKLETLALKCPKELQADITCLHFLYGIFKLFDSGDYHACQEQIESHQEIFTRIPAMSTLRKTELLLYTALVNIGIGDCHKAQKIIFPIISEHNINYLPVMRIIRLVQLIIHYELGYYDLLHSEIRSIRRKISLRKEPTFRTETLMLDFLYDTPANLSQGKIEELDKDLQEVQNDKYELQILVHFDFTAWIRSKINKTTLSEAVKA